MKSHFFKKNYEGRELVEVLDDFELELKLVENHIKNLENEPKEKGSTIIERLNLLRDRAILDFIIGNGYENEINIPILEKETKKLIYEITDKFISHDSVANKIYQSFSVKFEDESKKSLKIETSTPSIIHTIFEKEEENNINDEGFKFKTVLYNLCSTIENVFARVLRDFYLNVDESNRLDNLQISLSDLKEVDSIEDAELMLLDKKVENNFYASFDTWYDKITNEISLNKKKKKKPANANDDRSKKTKEEEKRFEELKKQISEMFIIRNLFIHNGGIVNDKFKNRTQLNKHLEKGDQFLLDKKFINNCIRNTRNLIYHFMYKYCFTKYSDKEKIGKYYDSFTSVFLKHIDENIESIGEIFVSFSNNQKLDDDQKDIAKINYCIFKYYSNNPKEFKEEVERLNFRNEDTQFIMAKKILMRDAKVGYYIEKFLDENDEDYIFTVYDWPLMKIARKQDEKIKELFKKRFDDILNGKESSINYKEDNYGYEKEKSKKINRYKNKIKKWFKK